MSDKFFHQFTAMKTPATILFALLLTACAAPQPKPDPEIKRAQPKPEDLP